MARGPTATPALSFGGLSFWIVMIFIMVTPEFVQKAILACLPKTEK